MTISEPEEVATEYQDYSQFFLIWDTLDRIAETAAAEPTLSRESKAAWLKSYKVLHSLVFTERAVLKQPFLSPENRTCSRRRGNSLSRC